MTLEQFDHICRAAAAVAGVKKIYAFGANAVIPWLVNSGHPIPLLGIAPSREVDISAGDENLDTLIDGTLGEFSAFDETFAVYAHGVSLEAFQAPAKWRQRVGTRTEPVSGVEIIVPHPHDLIISKLIAGRTKDFDFANAVTQLFPLSESEFNQLLNEFREVYPDAETRLKENVEVWKNKNRAGGTHAA